MEYIHGENSLWMKLNEAETTVFIGQNDSVQDVINSVNERSTILFHPGNYRENIYINKSLHISSTDGPYTTHIFGEIFVTADNVVLQGMTFYPPAPSFSTLQLNASHIKIVSCRFVDNLDSLALYSPLPTVAINCEDCPHLKVVNNDFYGWKHAVILKTSDSPELLTNTFRFCQYAIFLTDNVCRISGNLFSGNVIGIHSLVVEDVQELLETNTFSGNVIPLLSDGKFAHYPKLGSRYNLQQHFKISDMFYISGVCSKNYSDGYGCISVGSYTGK